MIAMIVTVKTLNGISLAASWLIITKTSLKTYFYEFKVTFLSREEKSLKVVNKAATPAVREPPQFGLR